MYVHIRLPHINVNYEDVLALDWCPRPHLTGRPGIGQPLREKYTTRITLFYQGKIAIIGVHKGNQMPIYPGKGVLTCLLCNVVKKVGVRGCIS